MLIKAYHSTHEHEWDQHIANSANGVFQFYRKYMDYHADRFTDHSLLFYDRSKLLAVLPANVKEDTLYSHQGLSFGGIIHKPTLGAEKLFEFWQMLLQHLSSEGIKHVVYKTVPMLYHRQPTQADLYFLNNLQASIENHISTTIDLENETQLRDRRLRGIKKAQQSGLLIQEDSSWDQVWKILSARLKSRHNVTPTHTVEEIKYLQTCFPKNIKLYTAKLHDEIMAGVVIYKTDQVVHAQYICTSDKGSRLGALDLLIFELIQKYKKHARYFDFGISTVGDGKTINFGLMKQKEEFGGTSTIHQIYRLNF